MQSPFRRYTGLAMRLCGIVTMTFSALTIAHICRLHRTVPPSPMTPTEALTYAALIVSVSVGMALLVAGHALLEHSPVSLACASLNKLK